MARATKRVWFLVVPRTGLLDIAGPWEVFGHANDVLGRAAYRTELVGPTVPTIETGYGLVVGGLRPLPRAGAQLPDVAIVAGAPVHPRPGEQERLVAWLRGRAARIPTVVSICTGAFVLGAAGVLDGRRATTHWDSTERLARRYPKVSVDPSVLYVDEGSVLTSAGVAAGLDLCLHVIRRDHGAAEAARIARRTVVAPHRDGGQAQFVARPIADEADEGASLEATRAWALDRLDQPLDVTTLARQACMSPRTFARRFRQETGTTPAQWVLDQRTRVAQGLLETTDLPVEHVAVRTGFGSATTLRTHFGRRLATTPTAYRRAFRQG